MPRHLGRAAFYRMSICEICRAARDASEIRPGLDLIKIARAARSFFREREIMQRPEVAARLGAKYRFTGGY